MGLWYEVGYAPQSACIRPSCEKVEYALQVGVVVLDRAKKYDTLLRPEWLYWTVV